MTQINKTRAETLLALFAECGKIALDYAKHMDIEIKRDNSVVTRADKAIEKRLSQVFDRPEQGIYMIGEETIESRGEEYIQEAFRHRTYVVDPIDGTAPYTAGVPLWGISIGVMDRGVLTDGAIYMPVEDTATFSLGGELWEARSVLCGNPEVTPFKPVVPELTRAGAVAIPQLAAKKWQIDMPNTVFVWCACVSCYHALLRGRLMGYLQHCKLWDVAGSMKLLELAGIEMRTRSGEKITCDVIGQKFFELNPGPNRWKVRESTAVGATPEIIDYIWAHVHENEPGK